MKKSKNTKRAMLASVLSMLMCTAMLVGSTFAWFTDSAATNVNKVQAGTLDVDLVGEDKTTSLVGQQLEFVKAAEGAGEEVLWEPGCTYNLPAVYVKNNGNLALKYKIDISGIDGDAKLLEAIEWTIKIGNEDADLTAYEGHLAAGAVSENALVISGHMKEEAGNEYQGLSIEGISITVYATQDTVEYDSIDNQYDKRAWDDMMAELFSTEVTSTDGMQEALTAGGNIKVMNNLDYTFTGSYDSENALSITQPSNINLAGKTISITSASGKNGIKGSEGIAATISNGEIIMNKAYGSSYPVIGVNKGDLTLDHMTVTLTADEEYCISAGSDGGKLTIKNSTITGPNGKYYCAVFCGSQASIVIEDSTINGKIKTSVNSKVELKGGDYTQATLDSQHKEEIIVYSGIFNMDPSASSECKLAAGSTVTDNNDGTWTVTAQ